jgi:hypothetical protein
MEGVFITDINGKIIQVTDIKGALNQAKGAISFHEIKLKGAEKDKSVIIFPDELKYWQHVLLQLEKVEIKIKAVVQEVKEVVTDTNRYSVEVTKAREMWNGKLSNNNNPCFIRNGKPSPLYGIDSNWLMFQKTPLRFLNVGESIYNSSNTKITRIF